MNDKVDMGEVNSFKDNINDNLKDLTSTLQKLKEDINALEDDDDFKGQTATNVKRYNKNYHIETIDRISEISKEFKSKLNDSIKAFESDVDENSNAIVTKSAINEYKDDIKESFENIEETKASLNEVINGVSDITSAKPITSTEVKDKGDQFYKQAKETVSNFEDFQYEHALDASDLIDMITPVSIMSSKVKSMNSDRARNANSSIVVGTEYKFYSTNNQIVELDKAIKNINNSIYFGKNSKIFIKLIAKIKNYMIVAFVAGDGNFFKGDRLIRDGKYREIGTRKIKTINNIMNSNIKNIKGENIVKAFELIINKKNHIKMSERLKQAYKLALNDEPLSLKEIKKMKRVSGAKNLWKKFGRSALDSVINPKVQSVLKNPENVKQVFIDELNEYKKLNKLGKSLKWLKVSSKMLGPVGAVIAIANNFANEKSLQKKVVGSAVDLGTMAATTGTGTMIGAAIGGPIGAGIGFVAGGLFGVLTEMKNFDGGKKSTTDILKEKANKYVTKFRHSDVFNDSSKEKNRLNGTPYNKPATIFFGRSLGNII